MEALRQKRERRRRAINKAMLCRGRRTVDGGRVQVHKHSSGGHRSEGWGEKQNNSSISLS